MNNNTQVWMTGSYTTGATYYSDTAAEAQAIADNPQFYDQEDQYVFIADVTPIEQEDNTMDKTQTWVDKTIDTLYAKGKNDWTQDDWDTYHYIMGLRFESGYYDNQEY